MTANCLIGVVPMPTHQSTEDAETLVGPTASGAKIMAISVEAAEGFLGRLDEPRAGPIASALGALQDDGLLIGVGILGPAADQQAAAYVAVARERRRLRIGSELLSVLLAEAGTQGLRRLHVTYDGSAAPDGLIRGSGAVTARRVVGGVVTAVLLVPGQH